MNGIIVKKQEGFGVVMKIGCCTSINNDSWIGIAKKAGLDFIETAFLELEHMPLEAVRERAELFREKALPVLAMNCMFPKTIRITGETVDYGQIKEYLHSSFEKASLFNIKSVVLGSGGARQLADGFSREAAVEQMIRLCEEYVSPVVEASGIVCCLEELNSRECNFINTCAEAMQIVKAVNKPNIRLVVDLCHVSTEGESLQSIAEYRGYISHLHIASPKNQREIPRKQDGDEALYREFFEVLKKAEYKNGLLSFEGKISGDPETGLREAVTYIRSLWKEKK